MHECEVYAPAHVAGLRCRNASPKPLLILSDETVAVCALTRKVLRRSQWHLQ